ncbi:MAG: ABC-type transporter ATP-binding protein EcsA [Firmicutes bacterium]|nr:ABC-type transporter ATP-binding protein EcsA [candidate division NPL-UPA2 bacterium]MBT9154795.1 ABC-type transporter ATP-binding protein EcsA [candidate division NPL-UPA2 bacterium]
MLSIRNVSKSYVKDGVNVVDNLNLEVAPGEIFGFLGPNGAGKTTTIKMTVGLLKQDKGSITVNGHDTRQNPLATKSSIGYVPDNPDLYDKLRAIEYINFVADVYGIGTAARQQRLLRLARMFEIHDAMSDLIGSFSHGMKQKLALTAALIHEPPLLILDEPMVGLDPRSAHLFKELMNEHCSQGKTVFFSTHILDVAERLCHRVGILRRGRLIACGTMEELRQAATAESSLESIFLGLTEK